MQCNPYIFRSYDIRGVVGSDLTVDVARAIGQGFGTYIQRHGHGKRVAIGRDVRMSSPELHAACVEGLRSTGCDVTDIGISLTPMMYFSVAFYGFDAGINITGSHNPKNENGFKLAVHPFTSIAGDQIQEIRSLIDVGDFETGQGSLVQKVIADDYIREMANRISISKSLKIVMDCGNGTAALYAPRLYRELGCEVSELYCDVDGNFPNHLPDPQDHANMQDLRARVLSEGADLGLAFDGDGDRVGIVDANGTIYPGDVLMIVLSRALLQTYPGATIIVDIKSSQALLMDISAHGGKPKLGRTGPPNHKAAMKEFNAPLAGEVSGHYFISDNHWGFDDGLFAGGRLLQAIVESGKPLHEYLADVPKFVSTPEIKVPCPDDVKFAVVEEISTRLQKDFDCVTVDGVRVNITSTGWALVRASNTTPNLTVRFEGATQEECDAVRAQVTDVLTDVFATHKLKLSV